MGNEPEHLIEIYYQLETFQIIQIEKTRNLARIFEDIDWSYLTVEDLQNSIKFSLEKIYRRHNLSSINWKSLNISWICPVGRISEWCHLNFWTVAVLKNNNNNNQPEDLIDIRLEISLEICEHQWCALTFHEVSYTHTKFVGL